MKKFKPIDEDVVQQIYNHLKTFDRFDNLTINVEEHYVAQIFVSVKIDDTAVLEIGLPSRDGLVGIPERCERQIRYLSWQVAFFEDVEKLLDAPLLVKSYKIDENKYALGETVVNGVKYEFSLSSSDYDEDPDFYIEVKFTKDEGTLQVDSIIKSGWLIYRYLGDVLAEINAQL